MVYLRLNGQLSKRDFQLRYTKNVNIYQWNAQRLLNDCKHDTVDGGEEVVEENRGALEGFVKFGICLQD